MYVELKSGIWSRFFFIRLFTLGTFFMLKFELIITKQIRKCVKHLPPTTNELV
jgi:hypothetical protein